MASRKLLTIVQMNDSHAYRDLYQEMFWQGNHAVYREALDYAFPAHLPENQKYNRMSLEFQGYGKGLKARNMGHGNQW